MLTRFYLKSHKSARLVRIQSSAQKRPFGTKIFVKTQILICEKK